MAHTKKKGKGTQSRSFTKIRSSGKKVELMWTTSEKGGETEHHVVSAEEPRPELNTALKSFVPYVIEILGLEDTAWDDELTVTALSIDSGEDGRRGLIITCRKELESCNGPLHFNTPHLREPAEDAEKQDGPGLWLVGMEDALGECAAEAELFLAGERSQLELVEK